jgi:hypothetical protein
VREFQDLIWVSITLSAGQRGLKGEDKSGRRGGQPGPGGSHHGDRGRGLMCMFTMGMDAVQNRRGKREKNAECHLGWEFCQSLGDPVPLDSIPSPARSRLWISLQQCWPCCSHFCPRGTDSLPSWILKVEDVVLPGIGETGKLRVWTSSFLSFVMQQNSR